MRNLTFGFFDDSGAPRDTRILMFYSFETEENLPRSGILHYHVAEGRFVGPRHDRELTSAALDFLARNGRLPAAVPVPGAGVVVAATLSAAPVPAATTDH